MRFLKNTVLIVLLGGLLSACQVDGSGSLHGELKDLQSLSGKSEYLSSPYVAAGDRIYVVGHQDGSFPDLGWHVEGEMGGVWSHPIKLMDGYRLAIGVQDQAVMCLPAAVKFENMPLAAKHIYPNVDGIVISQITFVPDGEEGVIVEYRFTNTLDESKSIDISFEAFIDLRPVWLSERLELKDGIDAGYWDKGTNQLVVKDSLNSWFTVVGSSRRVEEVTAKSVCNYPRRGKGVVYSLSSKIDLNPGESQTIQYFLSGSSSSREDALTTNNLLKDDGHLLAIKKASRYESLNGFNQLETNDPKFDQMYEWVRYNTDWLIRDVPELGRGLSAGIPDYPWWFGTDNGYAVEGMLAYGMFEEAISTIDLILDLSNAANGSNGQIMHEASTNGVIFNPGNLNTTPRFVQTLWMTYSWTGADSLFQRYWPLVQKSMEWIESQDYDNNGYPDGPGMMEIQGLHTEMIDVIAYQEQAYRAAANFAEMAGDTRRFDAYMSHADDLSRRINDEWWSDEFSSFADFRATRQEAIALTKSAILRADTIDKPWSVTELQNTLQVIESEKRDETDAYVVHHNWVVNTPMETGVAYDQLAFSALETAKAYKNRFGMFVTGIDRDERQEEATQWKSFSYVGAVMTLPTGVQAIASARYGLINDAFDYLKNLENSFSYALPGSMYEVSPDFGMMVQAWNAYAVAVPTVQYIAGIKPKAHLDQWEFNPQLPDDLEDFSLDQVRLGDGLVTVSLSRENESINASITQTQPEWEVFIPRERVMNYTSEAAEERSAYLVLTGAEITVSFTTERP